MKGKHVRLNNEICLIYRRSRVQYVQWFLENDLGAVFHHHRHGYQHSRAWQGKHFIQSFNYCHGNNSSSSACSSTAHVACQDDTYILLLVTLHFTFLHRIPGEVPKVLAKCDRRGVWFIVGHPSWRGGTVTLRHQEIQHIIGKGLGQAKELFYAYHIPVPRTLSRDKHANQSAYGTLLHENDFQFTARSFTC